MIPSKRLDIFPLLTGVCLEGLDAFIFFFKLSSPVDDCSPGRGGTVLDGRTKDGRFMV